MKWYMAMMMMTLASLSALGEHGSAEEGWTRRRAEAPARVKDCGDRIGGHVVRHPGSGLFAYSSYKMTLKFDEGGLSMESNYGSNFQGSISPKSDRMSFYRSSNLGTAKCSIDPVGCAHLFSPIEKELNRAKSRAGRSSDRTAINCALSQLKAFKASLEERFGVLPDGGDWRHYDYYPYETGPRVGGVR